MERELTFGSWLKQRRQALDLTRAALAAQVHCSVAALRKFEADTLRPSQSLAVLLADALEVASQDQPAFVRFARNVPEAAAPLVPIPTIDRTQPVPSAPLHSHLPVPLTPLIGRAHEVAAACALLTDSTVRLVTLIGPGGIGKTRVALQVAAEIVSSYHDGVVFVDLTSVTDPNLVAPRIAQVLGITQSGDRSMLTALIYRLRDKRCLLVLDNFEQLVTAAPLVADLLQAAPQVQALLTSRFVVGVYGEHLIEVPPLALPDSAHLPSPAQLVDYEAIRLFTAQAQAMLSSFILDDDNAAVVAAICERLDGLPLAIELAAARIRLFSPSGLLARLTPSLPLLVGGARTLPMRQQTLRATIAWSYDLLDSSEQALFRRLSVFVGGCTVEAVERVCDPDVALGLPVIEGLAALVDKSLLRQTEAGESTPRFVMLETIREYALDQLELSVEAETVRQQHAMYYFSIAKAAEAIRSKQHAVAAAQLEQEQPNMLAALTWIQISDETGLAARLVALLDWFWEMHGGWSQMREWLLAILLKSPAAESPVDHAQRLLLAADAVDDAGQERSLLEESLALYQAIGDHAQSARIRLRLGALADHSGNRLQAIQLWDESLAIARTLGDQQLLSSILHRLGDWAREDGDYLRAEALLTECLAVSKQRGVIGSIANDLTAIGDLVFYQGDLARAQTLYDEAFGMFQQIKHRLMLAWLLRNQGRVAHAQGDDAQAKALLLESLALFREHGWNYGIGCCLDALAGVIGTQGQLERAARVFGAGYMLRRPSHNAAGWSWPMGAKVDYEKDVANIRAALGEEAFAAAWAAGQALTIEQAIADALT